MKGRRFIPMPFRYRVYGICLHSPLALPELASATSPNGGARDVGDLTAADHCLDEADVHLLVREPRPPRAARVLRPEGTPGQGNAECLINRTCASLYWPEVGQFELVAGREVRWTPSTGCAAATFRAFLLGPVLSVLLHQRDFLVMHASAAAVRDAHGEWGAIGFMGRSGAGKSTLAAAFHARGHRAISDDALVIPAPPKNWGSPNCVSAATGNSSVAYRPAVAPGYASLRLWPQSLEALGHDVQALPLLYPAEERRVLGVQEGFGSGSVPLRRLYVLDTGDTVRSERLSPSAAMACLVGNTFCAGLLSPAEAATQFQQCGALARQLPVYRLRRPRDLSRLNEVAALVEAEVLNGQPLQMAASR